MKLTTEIIKSGNRIKRKEWKGYWLTIEDEIYMFCKDGDVINFRNSDDLFFTIDNLLAEDWEYATEENCEVLKNSIKVIEGK